MAGTLVGTRIREYEIVSEIGKGGMGTVYKARHIYIDQERAIKVIRNIFAEDPGLSDRFVREAKILSALDHPNLVRLFEFGKLDENTFFMVLEYVRGKSVLQRMEEIGKLPIKDSIRIVRQAALGLGSAHKKGIIHRDISPDNLMLVQDESGAEITKVIDFGIAKPLMEGTRQYTADSSFIGKPQYCSPEQTGILEAAKTIDHRTDIYSLAVTLYYMLVGKLPFYAPTPIAYLVKHATEAPSPIHSHDDSGQIPHEMDHFFTKALSKNREDRHPSMEAFAAELDQIVLNDPMEETGDFTSLFDSGKQHYDKGEWQEAIQYWKRAQKISPSDENLKQWIDHAQSQLKTAPTVTYHPPPIPPVPKPSGLRNILLIGGTIALFVLIAAGGLLLRKETPPDPTDQTVTPGKKQELTDDLIKAITQNDAEAVTTLIQQNADVNAKVNDETPLLVACRYDRTDILIALLEAGAKPNVSNKAGITPLMCSVHSGTEDNVRECLKAGADVNYQSPVTGSNALFEAIHARASEMVSILIKAGARVDVRNKAGEAPLLVASALDSPEIIQLLVDARANMNEQDRGGQDPLMRASYWGHRENVELLLKAGANVNARSNKTGETALFHAAQTGRDQVIPILLQAGAEIDGKNKHGENPVLVAAAHDNAIVLQLLIDAKANLNVEDPGGVTPLMRSCYWGFLDNVQALVKAGVDVNSKSTRTGQTALMSAAETSRIEIVKFLCNNGADPNLNRKNGESALTIAAMRDRSDVVQVLIDAKADPNIRDDQDATPLMHAAYHGYGDNVSALIRGGANVNIASSHNGETALTNAITTARTEVVSLLIKSKADVNIKTKSGDTPLRRAKNLSQDSGKAIVELLEKAGARE